MRSYDEEDIGQGALGPGEIAWCALMLLVILASVTVLAAFLEDNLYPEDGPALRLELEDLAPKPGFDLQGRLSPPIADARLT